MAQRQRAGLITPRSQDRNLLPVDTFFTFFKTAIFTDGLTTAFIYYTTRIQFRNKLFAVRGSKKFSDPESDDQE